MHIECLDGAKAAHLREVLSGLFDMFETGKHPVDVIVNYFVNEGLVLEQIDADAWCIRPPTNKNLADVKGKISWQLLKGVDPGLLARLVSAVGGQERYDALMLTFHHTLQLAIAYKYVHSPGHNLDLVKHIQPLIMAQLRSVSNAVSDTLQIERWAQQNKLKLTVRTERKSQRQTTVIRDHPDLCIYEADEVNNIVMKLAEDQVRRSEQYLEHLREQLKRYPTNSELSKYKLMTEKELEGQKRQRSKVYSKNIHAVVATELINIRHSSGDESLEETIPVEDDRCVSLSQLCAEMCALQHTRDNGRAVSGIVTSAVGGMLAILRKKSPQTPGHRMVLFPAAWTVQALFQYCLIPCVFIADELEEMFPAPATSNTPGATGSSSSVPAPAGRGSSGTAGSKDRLGIKYSCKRGDRSRTHLSSKRKREKSCGQNEDKIARRADTLRRDAGHTGASEDGDMSDLSSDNESPPPLFDSTEFLQDASAADSEEEFQREHHLARVAWRSGLIEES